MNMVKRYLPYLFGLLSTAILLGILPRPGYPEDKPIAIFVSIPPQKYIVNRIGQDYVTVTSMLDVGQNPVTYQPTPIQMTLLSSCQAYFTIGVPYERMWIGKIQQLHPQLKIIDTNILTTKIQTHNVNDPLMDTKQPHHHSPSVDPHIWTSPKYLKQLAQAIAVALSTIDPANKYYYQNNSKQLIQEFDALDRKIKSLLMANKVTHFMVYHPAWGHFARQYNLNQIAIEKDGKEPGAKALLELIRFAKEKNIKTIFIQSLSQQRSANVVANAIGAEVIMANPLQEDIPENLINFTRMLIKNNNV